MGGRTQHENPARAWEAHEVEGPNPMAGNPLRSFSDVAAAVRDCYEPLVPLTSPGGARVRLGTSVAAFSDAASELEGFARPLWGLAPLAAGGGEFAHWERIRSGLASGTDPHHREYWGRIRDHDQRMVEMAAVGAGLLMAPDELWEPLAREDRSRAARWLGQIDQHQPVDNNWQWFRVLTDLGLARVGEDFDGRAHASALDRIEHFARPGGWYSDGERPRADWYVAFAFHTYGLLYAASGLGDPTRAQVFRERAAAFAAGPPAVVRTRRLGARVREVDDVPLRPGLVLGSARGGRCRGAAVGSGPRPLPAQPAELVDPPDRRPRRRPRRGLRLPDGPAGRVLHLAGLALLGLQGVPGAGRGAGHAFWTADEEPLDWSATPSMQPEPGFVLSTDAEQVVAVCAGHQPHGSLIEADAKYARFAYSSRFGFGADASDGLRSSASESTLVVIDATGNRRVHSVTTDVQFEADCVASTWRPWPDVTVETVLWPAAPWHVRAHRISTSRPLRVEEWGFALGFERQLDDPEFEETCAAGSARVRSAHGCSGLIDVGGRRPASARIARPNSNLLWPRTVVPRLVDDVGAGLHERITLVFGSGPDGTAAFTSPPDVPDRVLELLRTRLPGMPDRSTTTEATRIARAARRTAASAVERGRRIVKASGRRRSPS